MAGTMPQGAYVCLICRDPVPLDDAMDGTITARGGCLCRRCWTRETGATRLPADLERMVQQAADGAP